MMKKLIYLLPILLAFGCQQNTDPQKDTSEAATTGQTEMNASLHQLFEEVNVVKMHLFATQEAEPNAEDYPYTGKAIEGELLKSLGDGLQPNGAGGVFAVYHTENNDFYVLRVPGKYVSGDLVLAKWDNPAGKLKKVQDLAYIQCDEGVCHQQDAWLTDLDDSRSLELILRSRSTENEKVTEEEFTVMSQDDQGNFVKSDENLASLALKENYVMQNQK